MAANNSTSFAGRSAEGGLPVGVLAPDLISELHPFPKWQRYAPLGGARQGSGGCGGGGGGNNPPFLPQQLCF